MKYYEEMQSVANDELLAGGDGIPLRVENHSVKGGATVERGMILSSSVSGGIYEPVKTAADAEKVLIIAAEDGEGAATDTAVMPCYVSGHFHAEKLSTGASVVSAADFKESLRQVNIIASHVEEVY